VERTKPMNLLKRMALAKFVILPVLLISASPACAQLPRHIIVEQISSEIPGELSDLPIARVDPLYKTAPLSILPAATAPLKTTQPKPALRPRTADKLFWLHSSAFAGSMALDAWSTSRFLNYNRSHQNLIGQDPGICTEGNRSLGLMPSNGHIVSYFAAWTGGEVAATYLLKRLTRHAKTRWVRESWRAPISYLTAYHSYWGVHNFALCK